MEQSEWSSSYPVNQRAALSVSFPSQVLGVYIRDQQDIHMIETTENFKIPLAWLSDAMIQNNNEHYPD